MDGGDRAWFEEIDLDPESSWRRMGTRQLGARPWLVIDSRRQEELSLKAALLAERHGEVFAALPGAAEPGAETLALVERELAAREMSEVGGPGPVDPDDTGLHPLDRAGRRTQEDLCLLRRQPEGWVLAAASLCFPSRWRLVEKLGRPLDEVHGPVDGYASTLAPRVDHLLDRLAGRIVWRRNWFIHPDPALYQPDRPVGGDPVVWIEHCLERLHLRSERQTLRRLPRSGWILFTIRIQQEPLGRFVADVDRRDGLIRYLVEAPADQLAHRGLGPTQSGLLLDALR